MERLLNQFKAAVKYVLAGRKTSWQVTDYPLRFRQQYVEEGPRVHGRLEIPRWSVLIINWGQMGGLGETREAALADLTQKLEAYRAANPLPRPGSKVPIGFASSLEIDRREAALEDFARRVFGLEPCDYLLTDESSLWDFCADERLDRLHAKIQDIYGVDVADVSDAKVWKVLDRIAGGTRGS